MLKEAHAILGYYPAAEGLDLEVQKLGDGGYRSLNVVIVNASAKLAEGHSPEEDLVKEPAPGARFLTGPGRHQELVGEVVRGRHGGHGGIATAADIRDYLPHTYGDAVVVLQRHGCVVASWPKRAMRDPYSPTPQSPPFFLPLKGRRASGRDPTGSWTGPVGVGAKEAGRGRLAHGDPGGWKGLILFG